MVGWQPLGRGSLAIHASWSGRGWQLVRLLSPRPPPPLPLPCPRPTLPHPCLMAGCSWSLVASLVRPCWVRTGSAIHSAPRGLPCLGPSSRSGHSYRVLSHHVVILAAAGGPRHPWCPSPPRARVEAGPGPSGMRTCALSGVPVAEVGQETAGRAAGRPGLQGRHTHPSVQGMPHLPFSPAASK